MLEVGTYPSTAESGYSVLPQLKQPGGQSSKNVLSGSRNSRNLISELKVDDDPEESYPMAMKRPRNANDKFLSQKQYMGGSRKDLSKVGSLTQERARGGAIPMDEIVQSTSSLNGPRVKNVNRIRSNLTLGSVASSIQFSHDRSSSAEKQSRNNPSSTHNNHKLHPISIKD